MIFYEEVIATLQTLYATILNEIFARHQLATIQGSNSQEKSLDAFLQELKKLSKHCSFKAVPTDVYQKEMWLIHYPCPNLGPKSIQNSDYVPFLISENVLKCIFKK